MDKERFAGICYQASNWIYVGDTTGRGKNDNTGKANRSIKAVYGYPLRKDFPLTGHTEVRYSEDQKKVISEPVKLEQNYRNFDYESPWEGTKYIKDQTDLENDKKN